MTNSTNLQLPYLQASQAQKHVTVNDGTRLLDALVMCAVEDKDLTTPPGSPADGSRYIPASGATGAWATWDLNIAYYVDGAWTKIVPREGFIVYVRDEDTIYTFNGSTWSALAAGGYTDEQAQDAVGAILSDAGDIDFTYDDAAPAITAAVKDNAVTNARLADSPAWSIKLRNAATSGDPSDAALADLTEEAAPAAGDFLLGFLNTGEIRKFDVANLPGGGGYTDEQAQDAVGTILSDAGDIDFTYDDITPAITASVKNDSVTYAKMQNVSATDRLLGRDSAGAGDAEELTVGGGLEFTGAGGLQRSALTGDVTASAGSNATTLAANQKTAVIAFIIDGGGATITTGVKGDLEIPFGCTINQVTLLADQSGSIVIDIWKDSYANFPPVDADSITASAPPTISSATKSQDATLTGWTTAINAGDTLRFNVDSVTSLQRVTLSLKVTKS